MPLLLLLALVLLAVPEAAAGAWRWPLRGEVVTPFHVTPHPFAPGQHRGIDIAAAAGATVRSACPGRVRFAGRLPGRGRVVSVECGALVATYLELGSVAVRPGAAVGTGARIGTVAASHLQLGARRRGRPHGYVDPLSLFAERRPPPLGAAPRVRPPSPRVRPRPLSPPARPAPAERPARVPLAAWVGLALFAAGTPVGALLHRRRRRARAAARVERLQRA